MGSLLLSSVFFTSRTWGRLQGTLQPFRSVDVGSQELTSEIHPPSQWIMALVGGVNNVQQPPCLAVMLSSSTHALTTRQCVLGRSAVYYAISRRAANEEGSAERAAVRTGERLVPMEFAAWRSLSIAPSLVGDMARTNEHTRGTQDSNAVALIQLARTV